MIDKHTIETPSRTITVTVEERRYDVLVRVDAKPSVEEHQVISQRLLKVLEDCEHSGKWLIFIYPNESRAWKRQKDGTWAFIKIDPTFFDRPGC
jgi:hypothetical protein